MAGAAVDNEMVAAALTPAWVIPLIFVSGFIVNIGNMSWAVRWFVYISPCYYCFTALCLNQFQGNPKFEAEDPLKTLGLGIDNFWVCSAALAAFWLFFRITAYLLLRSKIKAGIN